MTTTNTGSLAEEAVFREAMQVLLKFDDAYKSIRGNFKSSQINPMMSQSHDKIDHTQ